MADNLTDSTSTTNSTNPNNSNNNKNNDDNNDNEMASVIIKEESEPKESNNDKGKRKMEDINECERDYSDNIQNIENQQKQQQQQQVVDSFSGSIIIYQLLQAANLFFQLDFQSVLSLTLTSKIIFKSLSSLISQHFTFHHKHTPLIHYHPKVLKIETFDIDGLFDNPCLSSVTEIEFTTKHRYFNFGQTTNYPFDKAITNLLPLNLTHLTIRMHFNQPINSLIHLTKLTHLIFKYPCGFNYPTDNLLPPNLTHLEFDYGSHQSILHLPLKLTHLTMLIYTNLQYQHIQKMSSLLYFNNEPVKRNLDERGSNSASESATQINM